MKKNSWKILIILEILTLLFVIFKIILDLSYLLN